MSTTGRDLLRLNLHRRSGTPLCVHVRSGTTPDTLCTSTSTLCPTGNLTVTSPVVLVVNYQRRIYNLLTRSVVSSVLGLGSRR